MQWCDGAGCAATEMFHVACLSEGSWGGDGTIRFQKQFFCSDCLKQGRAPLPDSPESCSSAEGEPMLSSPHVATQMERCLAWREMPQEEPSLPNEAAVFADSQDVAADGQHEPFKSVDTVLDYIIKFLEGQHSKSGKVPLSDRTNVLHHVRSALQWKTHSRTTEEINAKVNELNQMMMDLVGKL